MLAPRHWDDAPSRRRDDGDMHATIIALGGQDLAAGAVRAVIDPGARHMPFHVHWAEEELFYVIAGGGVLVLGEASHDVREGDAVLRPPGGAPHAFFAGDDGLDLLCFGENLDPAVVELPRAGIVRRGGLWWERGEGDPLAREVAAGPLPVPARAPRPACVLHWADAPADTDFPAGYEGEDRNLGRALGSRRTGLRRGVLRPGSLSAPPHWHSHETELFVVLAGGGELLLYDLRGTVVAREPLRPGSVVVRPPGTGVAHALQAGGDGLTYLAYGTRDPGEIVHYPRSSKVYLGPLLVRVEPVADYWDGEL